MEHWTDDAIAIGRAGYKSIPAGSPQCLRRFISLTRHVRLERLCFLWRCFSSVYGTYRRGGEERNHSECPWKLSWWRSHPGGTYYLFAHYLRVVAPPRFQRRTRGCVNPEVGRRKTFHSKYHPLPLWAACPSCSASSRTTPPGSWSRRTRGCASRCRSPSGFGLQKKGRSH